VASADRKLLGLFRASGRPAPHSSGIRANTEPTMEPAYDKLGLTRPASEPVANMGAWTDQPFLDLMTRKAIEVLSGPSGNEPFVLMVEAGLIDKQSHSNHAAGTIWDVIELDKAVGAAREWVTARKAADTLVIATADHGQSMTVIGVSEVPDSDLFDRTSTAAFTISPGIGEQKFTAYKDINTNVRAPYGFIMGTASSGKTGPPAHKDGKITGTGGFPDYQDADGDGYPENREVDGKGRSRLVVGFRTGSHTGASLPLTAEGPGSLLFTGYMDQTDIFFKMAAAASGDTAEVDALAGALANPKYPRTIGK
jgi:alkaline phosphatase